MKRSLLIVPFLLLFLFNACGNIGVPIATITPTFTASNTPDPTLDFTSPAILSELNLAIEDMPTAGPLNELEHVEGPSYQVVGVQLLPLDHIPTILHLEVRCECAENGQCCNTNRTFAFTIMTLQNKYQTGPLAQVSGTLNVLEVWCFDHANLDGVESVPWQAVKSYFARNIDGFQLWAMVTPGPAPTLVP